MPEAAAMSRHRGSCSRCGTSSPPYSTSTEARRWIREHRETCPRAAKAAVDWDDVDELIARARALKPLNPNMNGSAFASPGTPKRTDLDRWGRSLGGGVRWTGTNCLRASVANLLGADNLEHVPDPTPLFTNPDWLDHYSEHLAQQTGYRIEEEPAHVCLHTRNAGQRWIAVIYEPDESANHAIVARGNLVYHDPARRYDALPVDRVLFGMRLVPANAPRLDRWGAAVR